ncbi:CinA family protein [hot springs metagenome]|uniref:CinA family protein n=1 Tax=hot springs metagenome TaxID=433727 RepID=A0A5J4L5B7_9ZZZZ
MNDEILKVIEKVHRLLTERKLTISVAESCTGGLISHYLTTLAGASAFFEAAVVSYSVESKEKILKVSPDLISSCGVVSIEVAKEMAKKVRLLTQTDYAISTTGNLGPDVLEGKEKGLVYIAIDTKEQTFARKLILKGDRESNKREAALQSLEFVIEVIENDKKDD